MTKARNFDAPSAVPAVNTSHDDAPDPYLWLENILGDDALAWVRERNAESRATLQAWPQFHVTRDTIHAILDSKEQIPAVTRRGDWLYNFWRDDKNPRGLWRRATLDGYRDLYPAWETIIDLDALAKAENENWVWAGARCFGPAYKRGLVMLSRGGSDAHVTREYDLVERRFVSDGFSLTEAKSTLEWMDENTLYVATDFGPGSLTDSGYPRLIKRWPRGTLLAQATTIFEGQPSDVSVNVWVDRTPGFERTMFSRSIDFYNTKAFLLAPSVQAPNEPPTLVAIEKPDDAGLTFWYDRVLIELRSDWVLGGTTWRQGSLLVADANAYLQGAYRRGECQLEALFTPTATRSLAGTSQTRTRIILNILDNVASRIEEWEPHAQGWVQHAVHAPFPGTLSTTELHDPLLKHDALAEAYLLSYTDFLTPDTLYLAHTGNDNRERLKTRPSFFDAAGMRVEQRAAKSSDGTHIPYFIIWPKGATADGGNPTLLYGYGGFEVALTPWYSGVFGAGWFQHGGVLVVANIRGGGEFGPAWHQAAIKANKQRSYDDFIAVAQDLIANHVTSAAHLGIEGGSNGGLLVGAVAIQRPALFNAVSCQVPLLDMKRFNKLLAGASWMAEYGNPDIPAEWAWISKYSPYQNVRADQHYPALLLTTSTRDDRVHPGHARKMAARMMAQGHDVLYFENLEGGHGGAADNAQRADLQALQFAFLWQRLKP